MNEIDRAHVRAAIDETVARGELKPIERQLLETALDLGVTMGYDTGGHIGGQWFWLDQPVPLELATRLLANPAFEYQADNPNYPHGRWFMDL